MPKYYRYGYQPYDYEALWKGLPQPATQPAASTHSLGDVTHPRFIVLAPGGDPYLTHKATFERPKKFFLPRQEDPYWIHKQVDLTQADLLPGQGVGAFTPSRMEKQALVAIGIGAAAWYFLLRKGAPLRRKIAPRRSSPRRRRRRR